LVGTQVKQGKKSQKCPPGMGTGNNTHGKGLLKTLPKSPSKSAHPLIFSIKTPFLSSVPEAAQS
jgi:hypothetical protein